MLRVFCSLSLLVVISHLSVRAQDSKQEQPIARLTQKVDSIHADLVERIARLERGDERTLVQTFESPHSFYIHVLKSIRARNWPEFVSCLSEDARDLLAFELVGNYVVADAMEHSQILQADATARHADRFDDACERNIVIMCARWIPSARIQAGEALGLMPEDRSRHELASLDTVVKQLELFSIGMDVAKPMKVRQAAAKQFIRAFPDPARLIGTLVELIAFQNSEHPFPLPVVARLSSWEQHDGNVKAAFSSRSGTMHGELLIKKIGTGKWQVTSLQLRDSGHIYEEIKQAAKILRDQAEG